MSFYVAVRDVNVQSMLARTAASYLSKRLGTEVYINTFYLAPDFSVYLKDVQLNDFEHYPMFKVGVFDAKTDISDFPKIGFDGIFLQDVLVNMVKYDGSETFNVNEVFAIFLNDDDSEPVDVPITADAIIINNLHVVYWNQNKDHPEKTTMDYHHIDIDNIYGVIRDFSLKDGVVEVQVNSLSGKEKSGFKIHHFEADRMLFDETGLDAKNITVFQNGSKANLDLHFGFDDFSQIDYFEDSVYIYSNIKSGSYYALSDVRFFSNTMAKMTDTIAFSGEFEGTVSDFTLTNFVFDFEKNTELSGDIRITGLPEIEQTIFDVDIKSMDYNFDDLSHFAIPASNPYFEVPSSLAPIDNGNASISFKGGCYDFTCDVVLNTNPGCVKAVVSATSVPGTEECSYKALVNSPKFNLTPFTETEDPVVVGMKAYLNGMLTYDDADVNMKADVQKLNLFKNLFTDFGLYANFDNGVLKVNTVIDEPAVSLDFDGTINTNGPRPEVVADVKIRNFDFAKLNIVSQDTLCRVSGLVNADFNGFDIDDMAGGITVNDFVYLGSEGRLDMDSLKMSLEEYGNETKKLIVNNDFFDFELDGIINFSTLEYSLKSYLDYYVFIPWWQGYSHLDKKTQDFYVTLAMKKMAPLTRLFVPNLKISDNTTFTTTFSSLKHNLNATFEADEIDYSGVRFKNIDLKHKTFHDRGVLDISVSQVVFRDSTETMEHLGLDNLALNGRMADDSILFNIKWHNNDTTMLNDANIFLKYHPLDSLTAFVDMSNTSVNVNDKKWGISPSSTAVMSDYNVTFNNFDLYSSDNERIVINGNLPFMSGDTLSVNIRDLDISDFNIITQGQDLRFNGDINGDIVVSGLYDIPSLTTDMTVDSLSVNEHLVGNVMLLSMLNVADTSVVINADIERNSVKSVNLNGSYYAGRENDLDFALDFDEFDVSFVNPFTRGVVSRMNGDLSGRLTLGGSIEKPLLKGFVKMADAGCNIDFLNTYYTFDHSIIFDENIVTINDMVITDTIGEQALLNATLTHNYLRDIKFDVDLRMNNFLGMNIPSGMDKAFYGTAIASGIFSAQGSLDDIRLGINATTRDGTHVTIPLPSTSSVNDEFIIFVNNNAADTVNAADDTIPEVVTRKYDNLLIDLTANVTQDAKVDILLPSNMGSMEAVGTGSINLNMLNDDMRLNGEYVINSGNFVFSLRNIVKRTFELRNGGRIVWTGDASDADIDVVGVYKTKSSLNSLGIAVDSTSMSNNINVNCIIRLSNKLQNPTLNFGIELPNATNDVTTSVFSVIDTTDQSVMAQQVLSLLVLGEFLYTAGSNSWSRLGSSTYYSVITDQISNWLSQISSDIDVGVSYTPQDNITNEELEVALSTQLFNDRLIIEGNFGMYTSGTKNSTRQNASNVVGDFDLTWKLTNRLSLKAYNHSNTSSVLNSYSFDNYSEYTQGVGFSLSQNFDRLSEVFVNLNKMKRTIDKAVRNKKDEKQEEKQEENQSDVR